VSTAPDGGKVIATLPVPASEDVIVLLDPDVRPSGVEKWHPFPNILRMSSSGDVVWRSELLPNDTWKCYLAVEWEGEDLLAMAASYRVRLDTASGKVTDSTFTK
jgi:predicted phage-related endonuclease